jgi:uncharacterized protein (TIGR02453 family)
MAFEGFSRDGDRFFAELAARQDREWFKAHRADFTALWETPLKALLEELEGPLAKQYRGVKLEPPRYFRIYRDVRFSKDKSPFKTNVAAMIAFPGGEGVSAPAAIYVSFGLLNEVAAGHWMLTPDRLKRYRALLADEKIGRELQRRADALERAGFRLETLESTQRVPPGFDPQHPRARLLKLKGLGVMFPKIPAGVRHSPKLSKWIIEQSAHVAPTITWLEERLAP